MHLGNQTRLLLLRGQRYRIGLHKLCVDFSNLFYDLAVVRQAIRGFDKTRKSLNALGSEKKFIDHCDPI